jgi:Lon protease-like protein
MTKLPQFPLTIVVFPSEEVHLHIFEDRYKQLISEAAEENIAFGIPPFIDGQISEIGTEVQLKNIDNTFPDGKMNITCKGLRLYRITQLHVIPSSEGYSSADIEYLDSVETSSSELRQRTNSALTELTKQLGGRFEFDLNEETLHTADFIHKLGFDIQKEYELLCFLNEEKRLDAICHHLDKYIPQLKRANEIRSRIKNNGHFRSFDPLEL